MNKKRCKFMSLFAETDTYGFRLLVINEARFLFLFRILRLFGEQTV